MSQTSSLNLRIVEDLYCEALVLSDEVRSTFSMPHRIEEDSEHDDTIRLALACEGLRTTTRMMHVIGWLLNHRAYGKGEISESQWRHHGRLAVDYPPADPARLALLPGCIRSLIASTEALYARLLRLDQAWREAPQRPLDRWHDRLAHFAPAAPTG